LTFIIIPSMLPETIHKNTFQYMENQGNKMKDIVLFSLYFQPNYCCYSIFKMLLINRKSFFKSHNDLKHIIHELCQHYQNDSFYIMIPKSICGVTDNVCFVLAVKPLCRLFMICYWSIINLFSEVKKT